MSQSVVDGKVVVMHYTLTSSNGDVLDSSRDGDPMPYLHGAQNIVPGLEKGLDGAFVGEKRQVVVTPAEGYGELSESAPVEVPRTDFPEEMPLEPGMQFFADTGEGQPVPVWVLGVTDDAVLLTQAHPLAGETLHFDVEIVDVRDANEDEQSQGHPNGITGDEGPAN